MSTSHITGFSFSYPNSHQIIENLNLKIEPNSKIALLGSNGVGKTTILNELFKSSFQAGSNVKLLERKTYFTQHIPAVEFNPKKITENYFEILLQIYLDESQKNEGKNIDFYPEGYVEWLMERVAEPIPEFKSDLNTYLAAFRVSQTYLPDKFSLLSPGTRKKVLLSMLLASKPDLIFADELTNHLDKEAIQSLIHILSRNEIPLLFIDHNQSFLDQIATKFIFIPDNKERIPIHFQGNYKDFRVYLEELEKNQQQKHNKLKRQISDLEDKSDDLQKLAKKYSESAKIGAMKRATSRQLDQLQNDPLLSNADLSKKVNFKVYEDKSKVKPGLVCRTSPKESLTLLVGENKTTTISNFEIYQGDKIRIIGKNGSGKSTLVKSLYHQFENGHQEGFAQFVSGSWEISQEIKRKNVFLLEQVTDYPEGITLENYLFEHTNLDPYLYLPFLRQLELGKFKLSAFISSLSLGEFIRLQLGVLSKSINEIKLIILDEPGNFLDVFTQKALVDMLHKYHQSLILITHDDILAQDIGFQKEYLIS